MKPSSERKFKKIKVKKIHLGDDIHKIAKKIVEKCKYIPEHWLQDVEDILHRLQMRTEEKSEGSFSEDHSSSQWSEDDISTLIDSCLGPLYSGTEEKIGAITKLLSVACDNIDNLHSLVQHQPMMSAISRLIEDDSICSSELTFNLGKVCLALSSVKCHRKFLSKYRIGSLIMSVVQLEVRRMDLLIIGEDPNVTEAGLYGGTRRNDNILRVHLSILVELSNDMTTFQKMLKRDLSQLLLSCVKTTSKKCLFVTLILLKRASIFEEVMVLMKDSWKRTSLIENFLAFLKMDDPLISRLVLSIFYNLSFDRQCRQLLIESNAQSCLMIMKGGAKMKELLWKTMYHFTIDRDLRTAISNTTSILDVILKMLIKRQQRPIGREVSAIVVNVS
jgi:hypothetical protein